VHDHEYRAHLFRRGSRVALGRLVHLEDVAERDASAATLVDEEVLLRGPAIECGSRASISLPVRPFSTGVGRT